MPITVTSFRTDALCGVQAIRKKIRLNRHKAHTATVNNTSIKKKETAFEISYP